MKKILFTFGTLSLLLLGSHVAFAQSAGSNFVPLTNIPAITGFSNATSLTAFFNNLYKICIGVAATLAVIQIMLAGVMYMGGDSVTETKQARAKIATAIGGLVLVLSPVIVFGIINPKILSLNVGFNTLTPAATQSGATNTTQNTLTNTPTGAATCTTPIANGTNVTGNANSEACCAQQTGCKVNISIPPGGSTFSSNASICQCGSS